MKTFATLATAGSYAQPGQVLVGRTVANTLFLKALATHGSFEQLVLFVGENRDVQELDRMLESWPAPARAKVKTRHLLELPKALANNELDVLHHNTPADKWIDLVWLRNRYAPRAVPVTGQVHSLSYPRLPRDLASLRYVKPQPCDAIFCSSTAGQLVMQKMLGEFPFNPTPSLNLPVVPLGVELSQVQGGDRLAARAGLQLPENAFVLLGMARFSEYDKTDLFPLLQTLRDRVRSAEDAKAPAYLLLAGARQGTQTPEMIQLWAKVLGVEHRLRLAIDFADGDKKHLLAASDVFVSPCDNVQETFGQSVVEAMAAGLPVIVSDFDGYKDTVTAEVGIRVPTRLNVEWDEELADLAGILYERPLHLLLGQSVEVDLAALSQAVKDFHEAPEKARQMGQKALGHAKARYAWENIIPQYEAVWSHLAAQAYAPGEAGGKHPLRLSLEHVFSHYPTSQLDPSRRVQRTKLSYELWPKGQTLQYVVYPELKHVFTVEHVMPVLEAAAHSISVGELIALAQKQRPNQPLWVAQLMVSWMLKQGLMA